MGWYPSWVGKLGTLLPREGFAGFQPGLPTALQASNSGFLLQAS